MLPEGTERAHSPTYLLLGSHLFLLRRKKTVEEETGERKKGGRGKGRKKRKIRDCMGIQLQMMLLGPLGKRGPPLASLVSLDSGTVLPGCTHAIPVHEAPFSQIHMHAHKCT